MKKIVLSVILLAGCAAFANARSTDEPQTVVTEEQVALNDDYQEVALTDLNEVVQAAINDLAGDAFDVKKVEFNAGEGLTKVTLANKEDASETVAILDKEGKSVQQDDAQDVQQDDAPSVQQDAQDVQQGQQEEETPAQVDEPDAE
ncbi:MAG: hypothetical protein FWF52_02765 [Candidatus Azobacteroides sp.]|nr:hypothetical protein [Candidatus Azobacteroides sp.]